VHGSPHALSARTKTIEAVRADSPWDTQMHGPTRVFRVDVATSHERRHVELFRAHFAGRHRHATRSSRLSSVQPQVTSPATRKPILPSTSYPRWMPDVQNRLRSPQIERRRYKYSLPLLSTPSCSCTHRRSVPTLLSERPEGVRLRTSILRHQVQDCQYNLRKEGKLFESFLCKVHRFGSVRLKKWVAVLL
jgi:hypothetical protein